MSDTRTTMYGYYTAGGILVPVSVDVNGNLNVNASVSSGPTNITQINSVAVSATNGLPVSGNFGGTAVVQAVDAQGVQVEKEYILYHIIAGHAFQGTTGNVSTAGAATDAAFGFFTAAANTKNILIYSLKWFGGNGNVTHELRSGTTNPALGTNMTITNKSLSGGAATSINGTTGTLTYTLTTTTVAGNQLDAMTSGVNNVASYFTEPQQDAFYLPAGTAASITLFLNIAGAGNLAATFKWLEL